MSYDPHYIPEDNLCFTCKKKEHRDSFLTGIGVYCTTYKSGRDCIAGGWSKYEERECRGYEVKQ